MKMGSVVKLPSGRYKTRKVDLVDWNNQENAEVWRKAWADLTNDFWRGTEAQSVSTTAATLSAALTSYLPSTWAWRLARWRRKVSPPRKVN